MFIMWRKAKKLGAFPTNASILGCLTLVNNPGDASKGAGAGCFRLLIADFPPFFSHWEPSSLPLSSYRAHQRASSRLPSSDEFRLQHWRCGVTRSFSWQISRICFRDLVEKFTDLQSAFQPTSRDWSLGCSKKMKVKDQHGNWFVALVGHVLSMSMHRARVSPLYQHGGSIAYFPVQ
jgi:hypothetical protein